MVRRHFGKIVVTLAVALTGAAITAPGASAAPRCVSRSFGPSNTPNSCVLDLQVLLNDLTSRHWPGYPNPRLTPDGYYGTHTSNAVLSFNSIYGIASVFEQVAFPSTWQNLCAAAAAAQSGHVGYYYRHAGC
jgi:peptidoglycan hydrolase-like protein with peptidoglycan-binding domain